eukprot:11163023-Lingulodinium_polyedra.AAC.1
MAPVFLDGPPLGPGRNARRFRAVIQLAGDPDQSLRLANAPWRGPPRLQPMRRHNTRPGCKHQP